MKRVLDWQEHEVRDSQSVLGIEKQGSPNWSGWDRYLTVRGKRIYHLGTICGTCQFLFECVGPISRGKQDNITAQDLVLAMTKGLKSIEPWFLEKISLIMPEDEYIVGLILTTPRQVTPGSTRDYFTHEQVQQWGLDAWGLPHHPRIKYYRGDDQALSSQTQLYEFIVPMYPDGWLDDDRVAEFQGLIKDGVAPTGLAISVLDVKQHWDSDRAHWCLTHYLADGHHKIKAASLEGKPITLLSFLAISQGASSRAEIDHMVELLNTMCTYQELR